MVGFGYDDAVGVTWGDALAGGEDEEVVGVPLAIDPALQEAEIALDALVLPAAGGADVLHLALELEGLGEFEVDQGALGVMAGPVVHGLEQVAGGLGAVLGGPCRFESLTIAGSAGA